MKSSRIGRGLLEIAVVFIGIWAALLADSWWDGEQSRAREADYLIGLAEDFAENEARLRSAMITGDSVSAAASSLLSAGIGPDRLGPDSLTFLLSVLRRLPTFEPVTKTYDNILGAGDLLTLRNPELRAELADFQSRLTLMTVVQETQERQFVSIMQPYFIEHLDYVATLTLRGGSEAPTVIPEHAAAVQAVLSTREFRNFIAVRLDWSDDVQNQHRRVLERVRAVLQLLRATA